MSENNYGALMMKSAVGASDDINAIFQPGIYIIPPSNTSSPDATGGVLTVHSGTPIRRTFTSYAVICLTSTRNGSTWSAWKGPLSRTNPFADIKADGTAAIAEALSNLGLGEAAKRNVGTGANQIPDMSSFTSGGGEMAGWRLTPDGFIEQWGQSAQATSGRVTVTFPVAFTTKCMTIQITEMSHSSVPPGAGVQVWGLVHDTVTLTTFAAVNGSPTSNESVRWRALGK